MANSPAAQALALDDDGTPTVHQCIRWVMKRVKAVAKTEKVKDTQYMKGFDFRGIDNVLNAVGPRFREIGIIAIPHVLDLATDRVETLKDGNRRATNYARITIRYEFVGPAGDSLTCEVVGEAMDSGDKATSKAMSVAFRTALIQVLALPTQEERDPDHDLYELAPAKTAKDFAELIMATDITMDNLRDYWLQARDGKKLTHRVTGPDGKAIALGDLIKGRKNALENEFAATMEDTAPRTQNGKLNRAKMTDAERTERGIPGRADAKAFKAEHDALVNAVMDNGGKLADRDTGPAFDDPWSQVPPGDFSNPATPAATSNGGTPT